MIPLMPVTAPPPPSSTLTEELVVPPMSITAPPLPSNMWMDLSAMRAILMSIHLLLMKNSPNGQTIFNTLQHMLERTPPPPDRLQTILDQVEQFYQRLLDSNTPTPGRTLMDYQRLTTNMTPTTTPIPTPSTSND